MRFYTPHPMGEAVELIMNYEEAYDLMNDLHETLHLLDNNKEGRMKVRRSHQLELGSHWPSILRTVVYSREN